jgi:hypothetical protein
MFHELRKVKKAFLSSFVPKIKVNLLFFEVEGICRLLIFYSANSLNQKQYPNHDIKIRNIFSDEFLSKLFFFKEVKKMKRRKVFKELSCDPTHIASVFDSLRQRHCVQ